VWREDRLFVLVRPLWIRVQLTDCPLQSDAPNARRAYDERRLTAQQEPAHAVCVYSGINDRDCVCVIGASSPPKTSQRLIEREAYDEPIKRLLYYRRSTTCERSRQ
jgi:hypothetical protein